MGAVGLPPPGAALRMAVVGPMAIHTAFSLHIYHLNNYILLNKAI